MKAYHFLQPDMRAAQGNEQPWEVGETRRWKGPIKLCRAGYHCSPTLWDALQYAQGPIACLVEVSEPLQADKTKQVSRSRKLIRALNIHKQLIRFAADCAERVLHLYESAYPDDDRPRKAIEAARAFARGEISAADAARAAADTARAAYDAADADAYAAYAAAYAKQRALAQMAELVRQHITLPEQYR